MPTLIPVSNCSLQDYLDLVGRTGRAIRDAKRDQSQTSCYRKCGDLVLGVLDFLMSLLIFTCHTVQLTGSISKLGVLQLNVGVL
jgi:hypothetical protein